jgi:peptide/nickel transport system permease protein
VVEDGPVGTVFHRPRHPYTRALLEATPEGDELPTGIGGVVPLPQDFPQGCRFAERCGFAIDACRAAPVPLREVEEGRRARCIRSDEMARLPEAVA